MFLPFSSSCHPLINRLDTEGLSDFWLLTLSIFVLTTIFLSTFISFAYNSCLVFNVSVLVSSAYVIIRCTVALYIFYFVSFLLYWFFICRHKAFFFYVWWQNVSHLSLLKRFSFKSLDWGLHIGLLINKKWWKVVNEIKV